LLPKIQSKTDDFTLQFIAVRTKLIEPRFFQAIKS
jgi:hypothetical protein